MERKKIPSHPGYYADRKGGIWRVEGSYWIKVNPVNHAVGYQYTYVNGAKYLTQRLVCSAFKGESLSELPLCIRRAKRQQPRRVRSQRFLKWGTHKDKPKRSGYHHLTYEQRLGVVKLYKNGYTQISIAEQFGVTQPTISYIVNGHTKLKKYVL